MQIAFTKLGQYSAGNFNAAIKVNRFSYFTKRTSFGENCHFNGFRVFGEGKCHIGDNFHSGFGCSVLTSNHDYNGESIPYDNTHVVKDVYIDNNVWFGIKVTVCPGVTIGEGAIIQAGSVVVKDIPALSIAGGAPAKVFSSRNEEHYFSLKEKNKFF
jgi:maltose O-acetyltransferase